VGDKMKKINNKGYMLVEIIVASSLAMIMAYFLIDVTLKLKDSNTDAYFDTLLTTDKILITNQIMNDVINCNYVEPSNITSNSVELTFYNDANEEVVKTLSFTTEGNMTTLRYGDYKKDFAQELTMGELVIEYLPNAIDRKYLHISLPAYTLYSDYDYGINLLFPIGEV